MKAKLVADYQALPSRLKFAGALAYAGLALAALDASVSGLFPPDAPRAAPGRVEAPQPAGLRNLAYYPEQLAALTSMAEFEPRADGGATAVPAAEPPAAAAGKPIRHVTARARAPEPAVAPPSTARIQADPQTNPQAASQADNPVKVFGFAIPQAAAIGARVVAVRDSAFRLGEAAKELGGRIATYWR